jgi:hypothetical protein
LLFPLKKGKGPPDTSISLLAPLTRSIDERPHCPPMSKTP